MWEGYRGLQALQGACGAHPASGTGVTLAKRLSPISQALLCSVCGLPAPALCHWCLQAGERLSGCWGVSVMSLPALMSPVRAAVFGQSSVLTGSVQ